MVYIIVLKGTLKMQKIYNKNTRYEGDIVSVRGKFETNNTNFIEFIRLIYI